MKSAITTLCIVFVFPCVLTAAQLQLEFPQGLSTVYLLSEGTPSVLEHLRTQQEQAFDQLKKKYKIDILKEQTEKAAEVVKEHKQAYEAKLASLRKQYLDSISLHIVSSEAEISPASSALGEVSFIYMIKNNSDRIITDINYIPKIGGITLPTTSALILELIHPLTLKSGLGPNETLSNKGHDPEHFSFFLGELTREELSKIRSEIKKNFTIEIKDMHFTDRKGYKGQTKVMGFEESFTSVLQQGQIAIEKSQADEKAKKTSLNTAMTQYNKDKEAELVRYKNALEDLKKTAVRYQMRLNEKNRCTFEDIPAGTYHVYARNTNGLTIFTEINVKDKKTKLMLKDFTKDPFAP